jgi:transposase
MPKAKDTVTRNKAKGLLESHWRPQEVASKLYISQSTAYGWEQRMQMFNGQIDRPEHLQMVSPSLLGGYFTNLSKKAGRPRPIHAAAEQSLLEYIARCPWIYQDEMVLFLEEEWDIRVNRSTVSRLLQRNKLRNKKGQRIGHTQSQALRVAWQAQMHDISAEQMVFIDESLFKQQTGWRLMAYGPIGSPARYADDMARGNTWSILPAYTVDGYLPCTGIRLGFFNGDAFVSWILNELLPHLRPFPEPRSVVCLDNLNVHLDARVRTALEERGCLIRFLPPYSPDFNPIELTFSMLKVH